MAKGPTVYDVAEAAGVSIATVSFTFRQPAKVRPATREAVHQAARRLGYVPSASARGLAAGRTGVIGLIAWDLLADSPERSDSDMFADRDLRSFPRYVDEVQRGIELATWRHGYTLMIGGGNHANSENVIIDIAGRSDGLIVLPHTMSTDTILPIAARIPVVIVSEFGDNDELNRVTIDNEGGVHQLVGHLLQAHAVRTIRFVGRTDTSEYRVRWNTVCHTLAEAGLVPPVAPLTHDDGSGAAVLQSIAAEGIPDAFVCRADSDALDAMDALRAQGIRVPQDVVVTGFDGIAAGLVSTPQLTTVRQPMQSLGEGAAEMLIRQLVTPTAAPSTRVFPVSLETRGSCGCATPQP